MAATADPAPEGAGSDPIKALLDATQQEKFASLSQQPAKDAAAK